MAVLLSGCGLFGMIFEGPECTCDKPAPQAQAQPPAPPPTTPPALPQAKPEPPVATPSLPAPPAEARIESTPIPPPPAAMPPSLPAAPAGMAPTPLAPGLPGAPPAATAPPAVAPTALPGTGQYGAQLGAFRTRANAERAWGRFKDQYTDLLAAMPGPLLRDVDLGQKGRFTRVMSGPFSTQQAAQSLCMEVLARGGFCHVQRLGR